MCFCNSLIYSGLHLFFKKKVSFFSFGTAIAGHLCNIMRPAVRLVDKSRQNDRISGVFHLLSEERK